MQTTLAIMVIIITLMLIVQVVMTELYLATIEITLKRIERWMTDIRDELKNRKRDG